METTPLFEELLNSKKKFIILQGGGDAGKTVTALQFLAYDARHNPGTITTVTGQDLPNLKRGAIRSYRRYVEPDFRRHIASYNSTEATSIFKNQSTIEFKSFKDELDARGSERDNLFMNEANSQSYQMFWQLQRKTRRKVIIDYNPTAPFWVHETLMKDPQFKGKWAFYQIDHRHNPFLSQEEHEAYENITDPELFRVYSRGETGRITGLIFNHFKKITPDVSIPQFDRVIWGIDYGYTNDPTALVKVGIKGRQRWFFQLSYTPGMSAQEIKNLLDINGRKHNEPLYSEVDKEMILQLRKLGVIVQQAKKGPGSQVAGISKMKEYECWYQGEDFENEINNYKYITATDMLTGRSILTNEPMDGNDHLCQASTYAVYTDSFIIRAGAG